MAKRIFSESELAEAVKEALENWDFEAVSTGDGEQQKRALQSFSARKTCAGGTFEVPRGFSDIWDWLAEWASTTAADM